MRSSNVSASEEEIDISECYKESRQLDALHFYTVPEGRDGGEKGRALGRESGRTQREALTAAKKDPAPLAAAPRKVAGAPSCDMKRDTRTKVYPTDADAKKRRNIIQSHYQRPDAKFKGTSK